MNLIEERIRAAARAAADTVTPDSVPSLELPATRARRLGRRHGNGRPAGATWTRWAVRLAPLGAALAVSGILIAVVTLSPPAHQGGTSGPTTTGGPDVPAGPPVSTYVESGQVPRYYVQIAAAGARAVVHATVSGMAVATIRPTLTGWHFVAVMSAGDGRTFALAVQDADRKGTEFDEFRLSRSGQPSALTLLPVAVPAKHVITGLALSPDGGTLAVATRPGGSVQRITLYPLHGKPARTWSASDGTIGATLGTRSLSWTAGQRTLAFDWFSAGAMSVRLLDVGTGGGSLLAASRPAVTLSSLTATGQTSYLCPGNSVITPDGSAIVCAGSQITSRARDKGIRYSTGFAEFSAATGRLTRILAHWPTGASTGPRVMDVLWSDASGRIVIGAIRSAGRLWVGVISGNEFTPLDVRWDPAAPDLGTW